MDEIYYRVPKNELIEIYNFHYNYTGNKRSLYVWEWEYGDRNPQNSLLLAVKVDGNVIATQGMLAIKIAFGEDVHVTGKNESLLIDTNFRGKSLSTRLYNYAISEYEKEKISFLWGFSKKAPVFRKANFMIFEDVLRRMVLAININQSQLIIPKDNLKGLKGNLLRIIVFGASIYSNAVIRVKKLKNTNKAILDEICEELKSPTDITNLYRQLLNKYPDLIYIYQDETYFKWRIQKSPYPVKTMFLYSKNELQGYFYLKIQAKFCELIDFTFSHERYGKQLLNELVSLIFRNKYGFIFYTGNKFNKLNIETFDLLASYGFVKMKGPNSFVLRNFDFVDEIKLSNIENWYMNDLWSEGI